jgi:putative membrane protein insertion efficiency factor
MRRTLTFVLLLPRNVCVLVLRAYRAAISPLYGDVCRYYPSCSHFTLQAIQQYGVIRGIWMGSRRIARCHPWAEGGIDDVPRRSSQRYTLTSFGFVVANSHGKGFSQS